MKEYLFTPGPVPVSREVAYSESRPLIGHRGKPFSRLFVEIEEKLGGLLRTSTRTVVFPASGTGALESLAVNLTGPGTHVLSVSCGAFGDRFREIVARTGADMTSVDISPGEGATPELVAASVASNPNCDVLLLTHNETSTGVCNPIDRIIAALPAENRPLVLVDGVSSVGAMPCFPEKWGIDGLATASQKGLLTPPGLGLVWLSERAWKTVSKRTSPSYYFDLRQQRDYLEREFPENPYTPPVSLYYALHKALNTVLDESWFPARLRASRAFAAGLQALGFTLLVRNEAFRSSGVTAFGMPDGADVAPIIRSLRSMGIDPAGGQGALKGKIIRMAHYHDFDWPEISLALGTLYAALDSKKRASGDFMRAALAVWEERQD